MFEQRGPRRQLMQQQQLGKYKFEQFLGGGMSHVYKARDTLINRIVVVKILTDSGMHDEDTKKRFLREAQTAGAISHENIVRVYDFGEHEGRPYMVMEYLQGNDLRASIQQGQLGEVVEKLRVLVQLARAMQHIHGLGIVHRDLKPDNVFLSEAGSVKLMDFGIAKTKDLSITRTGYTLGTPYYMAPEQVMSKDVGQQADIYAFGIVMFELFTGLKPFRAENVHEVFFKILNEAIDLSPLAAVQVPASVIDLIKRCAEKDQAKRPSDFGVIIRELEAVLKPMESGNAETITQLAKPKAEIPKIAWIGIASVLLVIVVLLGLNLIPRGGSDASIKKDPAAAIVELPPKMQTATGEMVLVKEGDFLFGEANEKRAQKGFYMDAHEVTNEDYKKFAMERGWPLPETFPDDENSQKLPVVNVTFMDAREFAAWAGKRIPYAVEWEKAARGSMGRTYPWGYEHLPEMAVVADNPKLKGLNGPKVVGSWTNSDSTYKVMDLAGNVFEWVDERTSPSPPALRNFGNLMKPPPTAKDLWVQIRGGSFSRPLETNVNVQFASIPANFKSNDIGFRCVADVGAKPK
jgi:formylglycine-generating enzyme required for sulfatase activity/tRNA A-37 threonylcarbamoyl transferase component Bud32